MRAAALALITSCSFSANPPPPAPGPTRAPTSSEQEAVALGVTVDARDDQGAPRLIRAIVPRPAAAGMAPADAARDHLAALTPLFMRNQQASDLTTHSSQQLRNGASIVRLIQQVDHIDIHQGELRVMVHPDGSLAAVAGTLLANPGRATFRSNPVVAVERALDALYGPTRARPAVTEGVETHGFRELTVAATPEFSVQAARAKRELLRDGRQLIPIWSVELFTEKLDADDNVDASARRYLVADKDGRILRDINLTANDAFVYRAFADSTGARIPLDSALESYSPHPTGTPDGSLPNFGAYNLVVMDSFNGPRDPWLGAAATTTSGNNVDAFADIARPAGFGPGDIRPEVRAGRTLNYQYDFTAEPLATPTQSKAAAVNLFFVTNWLHDWYYDSGFTEATGNAQVDNYGRGGVGGDPLIARAQSNALGGSRNNANMATPSDGFSPVMNMFLWSGATTTALTTPTATPASTGFVSGPRAFELTGVVALTEDVAGGTHKACGAVATASVAGKIALFEFDGTCGSATAVNNLKAAGAIGVIATIAVPGAPTQSLNGSATANLPGLVIGEADGVALKAALPVTITLSRTTSLEFDGDFDNAIVAHEWGHYLHNRLASCEVGQCGAISEGWGDFTALHMMLRTTDDREGTFAAGLYALTAGGFTQQTGALDPGYFGIRRFPYSLNRAKNGLSFRHIGDDATLPATPTNTAFASNPNSEVHNAGEIWAQMLWEVYNVLIDEHGQVEARRRMSDYVVAGLLLTPPDATFTESRDAILAAAGALDTDDMILIAAAFAGRGAGTCAASPARSSVDFLGVVESGTIAARLETSGATVADDGASCDRDGYLDPGETGTLRLSLANSGVLAAEGVVIRATTTTPGVTLGKPVTISSIAAFSQVDVAIPVTVATSAPTGGTLDIAIQIDGDAGCNTRRLQLAVQQPLGVDEAAAVSATDKFDTNLFAWTPTGAPGLWSRAADTTGNHALFGINAPFTADTQVMSPVLQASPTQPLIVSVKHAYDLEATPGLFFDGGVVEVSNDLGMTWRDVTAVGVNPGYPGSISAIFGNPLGGRPAFSGTSPNFPAREALALDFGTQFAGQAVQLRFRIGTDFCCTASGWQVDDIAVTGITNTPFPGFLPEPTKCSARATAIASDGVLEVRTMPRASLDGVPGAGDPE
jgi:large repetitive protein